MQTLLNAQNITIETGHGILLEDVNVSISEGDRIGFVGPNGSGKSTLMKVLAGLQMPTSGRVNGNPSSYYVPQLDLPLFQSDSTIFEYLSQQIEDWWEVLDALERSYGVVDLNVERNLNTLSGGELMKLHLTIALVLRPAVLFLDEPTNHMDIPSIESLISFLEEYKGSIMVTSHDPFFLDHVTSTTWEIRDNGVYKYGGSYSQYKEQKIAELGSLERQHEAARKELKKIDTAAKREAKRAARSRRTGRQARGDSSMSAMEKGFFAERASSSAGTNANSLSAKRTEIEKKVLATKKKRRKRTYVDLKSEDESAEGRTLVRMDNIDIKLPNGNMLVENVELRVSYGDRIVIAGANGAGKTILAKSFIEGAGYLAQGANVTYLSQKYEIVDPALTLVENVQNANPDLNMELTRRLLANFLFFTEQDIYKKAQMLSGGEVARLAFAMVTASPVDLLILDEPTNNLDLETVESIEDALAGFDGALVVISHNIDFLSRLDIDRSYIINHKRLKTLSSSPEDEEVFYEELISELDLD